VQRQEWPLGNEQIGQSEQRHLLRMILGQAPVAGLLQAAPVVKFKTNSSLARLIPYCKASD
jgi:hypothetical protein